MREGQIHEIILMLVLVLAVTGCAGVQVPGKLGLGVEDLQAIALDKLRAQSEQPPKIHFEVGIPRFVSVQVAMPKNAPDDPVVRALDFLERYRDFYRIQNPRDQLYLERSVANETGQHVFFGQRNDDIPVFGAQLAVHLNKDAVIATNGNYLTDIPHFLPPAVDEKRAETNALKDIGANAERIGQPKLVYFNRRLFMTPAEIASSELDDDTHQAWRLTVVHNSEGHAYSYFIDAQTGAVLFRLNLSPSHAAQKSFDIQTANNSGPLFCGYPNAIKWFNENGVLLGVTPDVEGFKAFGFVHKVYDFFYDNFHRHSWDGNEHTIRLMLDEPSSLGGVAHFSLFCGRAIFRNDQAFLDIIAHEITHGITFTTSNLIYSNQSGALNESYSDVFAAIIQNLNWTIGSPAFRSLSSPPVFSTFDPVVSVNRIHPDHMNQFHTMTFDDGGVHINSGIPNKVAFLIAKGGTHNGITVSGIGRMKTAQLYYEVLTAWITNNANFISARNVTVLVAQIAAATGKNGFTSADVCAVVNAFASVGLGLPDLDCDGVNDSADTDDDGDTIADNVDNCPRGSNPSQADSDGDGIGDACDPDADNDGVPNTTDNCPLKANADQADKNSDGFGDVCSDNDLDGVLDSVDNCLYSKNPSQSDIDNDGIGDACDMDNDNDGILNQADNCSIVANPSQLDSDSDGYGNVCDSCPTAPNTGLDTNKNGIDNACDPDNDSDGILDAGADGILGNADDDNCPTVSNPGQQDINGNGIGTACDPAEQLRLGVSPHEKIVGAIQFRRDHFDKFQIPILPDICTGRDCVPNNFFAEVKVQLEIDLPMRIVDDQGFVVAQSEHGLEKVLRFSPKPDFFYWPPGIRPSVSGVASDAIKPYQGRQYFLEISPSQEVDPDRSYNIRIEASSGI